MAFQPELYSLLFAIAIGISLIAAVVSWQIRNEPGGLALVVCLLGITFWAGSVFGMTLVPGTELVFTLLKLRMLGVHITTTGMLLATLGYTGYRQYITRKTIGVLSAWVLVLNLVVWSRPELVWSTLAIDPTAGAGVETSYGIVFGIHALYSYCLVVVSLGLLVRFTLASRYVYQKQIVVVIGGIVAPILANVVYTVDLVPYDVTVVGFILTGIILIWVVQRERFFDVRPIARDRVIETLTNGILITNSDDRLIDCNQRAMELVDLSADDIGGVVDTLDTPLPRLTELTVTNSDGATGPSETETLSDQALRTTIGNRHYEITATPLDTDRGNLLGTVYLIVDITDQERRKARLQQQNKRLDQFASIVSHDLRNPLSVASGYLGLARTTGDPDHFDRVERSHRRMEELIDELLTFARLDDADIETSAMDLESCAKTAWSHVDTEEAELVVKTEATIEANREYLLQLMENLFRNSVEHGSTSSRTKPGDSVEHGSTSSRPQVDDSVGHSGSIIKITVRIETTGDTTGRLVVADDGSGIPPADRESVLEQGYTTNSDGTGLGLSIVSSIAEAHDWSVYVDESEHGGAAFVFEGITCQLDAERPIS